MFLLVPAHPGSPGQRAVKRSLLLLFVHYLISQEKDNTLEFTPVFNVGSQNNCHATKYHSVSEAQVFSEANIIVIIVQAIIQVNLH